MEVEISKESWVTQMRLDFCPPEMVEEDGALNLEYFQPKSTADDSLKWNEEDEKRLIIGIQKFGVGNWDEIRKEFLPIWDPVALRIRTMVLFGTQDLSGKQDNVLQVIYQLQPKLTTTIYLFSLQGLERK